jgi:hypothetical protein
VQRIGVIRLLLEHLPVQRLGLLKPTLKVMLVGLFEKTLAHGGAWYTRPKKFCIPRIFRFGALRARALKSAAPDERMESWAGMGSF